MLGFVCTTINPESKILQNNISLFTKEECPSYIVLDRKVLSNFKSPYINFRDKPLADYERLAEWDSYSRKNIGYIRAANDGCEYIFETDDDNMVLISPSDIKKIASTDIDTTVIKNGGVANVFKYFYEEQSYHLWARGFPIKYRENELKLTDKRTIASDDVGVIQFLVNGNPDVDAIIRLVAGADIDISTSEKFNGPTGVYQLTAIPVEVLNLFELSIVSL